MGAEITVAVAHVPGRRWPKYLWVIDGFRRAGCRVLSVRSLAALAEADKIADLVVLGQRGGGLEINALANMAEERRAAWVQWWFDLVATDPTLPLSEQPVLRRPNGEETEHLRLMRRLDRVFVKERAFLPDYRALRIHARWLDQGGPEPADEPCRYDATPEFDACFVGTFTRGKWDRRHAVNVLLSEGCSVAWAGAGGSPPPGVQPFGRIDWAEWPDFVSRAACCLCVDARHDVEGYWSDRTWMACAAGACVVRRRTPGFPPDPGGAVFQYETDEELLATVARLRGDQSQRAAAGKVNRRWVALQHTYQHKCQELIEQCRDML